MKASFLKVGANYHFIGDPKVITYIGKSGSWHQFECQDTKTVWAEVLEEDLHLLDLTNPLQNKED